MGNAAKNVIVCTLLVLAVNLIIAAPLFGVEYSAYTASIEGTFIAIARIMAQYPGQWSWWRFWNGGLPFENAYLPFTHWIVAAFHLLSGLSAARSFHLVSAGIYVSSGVSVFWMALELSRKLAASLFAALAYSCVSLSALLVPAIAADAQGALNLRRLQDLVFYGEAPHMAALALLPVAVVCFSRALTTSAVKWKILAGVLAACISLSNAFGIVALAVALGCWLAAFPARRWWTRPITAAAIAIVAYAWISPWLSPAMIRAMRANALTASGDFRYKSSTWVALAAMGAGFLLLWLVMRCSKASSHLQFFVLFGYLSTAFVVTWYLWNIPVIPQPKRYEQEMDLALLLAIVFVSAAILDRFPKRVRTAISLVAFAGLILPFLHAVVYARDSVRSADPASLGEYRIARWLDQNRPGQQAFITGSASLMYNIFTDNPQLAGGHEQHTVNPFLPIVAFTIYSGMNTGARDADYSIFWLKAYGARAISVSGPETHDPYPMLHPHKFDGVLPLVWQDRGYAIYEVPGRNSSLAHVIPASAVVSRRPLHGLDIAPAQAYVAALEDPANPVATFQWHSLSEAGIHATVDRGQVISVQVTYERGWEAWANGRPQRVRGDAIGQIVIEPDRLGPCDISLRYTGGKERLVTRALSLMALAAAVLFAWRGRRRTRAAQKVE